MLEKSPVPVADPPKDPPTVEAGAAIGPDKELSALLKKKVDVFFRTPPYFDYHWLVRGDVDETFGDGTADRLRDALLSIDASSGGAAAAIADAFQTERFVPTTNDNYDAIEDVGVDLGIIER